MNIGGINASTLLSRLSPESSSTGVQSGTSGSFGSAVRDAVESLDSSQKASDQEIASAVTGDSPDLHRTIIAMQTADLGFQFALQVRNKVMDAYQEIMRMQV
jgi:flagellar hook-basal body complex protein FliE